MSELKQAAAAAAKRAKRGEEWLTSEQLAAELGVEVNTIYKWATNGRGPRRHKLSGRCTRYTRREVDAWLRDKLALDATGLDAGEQ